MGRNRKGLPSVVAATAAAIVVAGLATTGNAAAAPASKKLAAGIATSHHAVKGTTDTRLGQLPAGVPKKGSYAFLLTLDARSTLSVQKGAQSQGKGAARAAAKAQLGRITAVQNAVAADLPSKSSVIYRTHSVLAGLAVRTDVNNVGTLQGIDGVTHVYPITPKKISNSYAVPYQGAAAAWKAYGDRGENSTIAVIDTGIDYTHANFGGPGTRAAYNAAHATEDQPADPSLFPTAKIAGGYDLVGDAYNADPTAASYDPVPHPDPNPLDCEGHGSHVAGSATGLGVNADGSTYTGAYNNSTPFQDLRIGPGVAPQAKLYAYRVFGCAGSSDVVGAAVDRAADPNQDGDTSDHADVINMSLGSDFGSPQDADSVVTNAASALGITMVVAAGNNGDLYDTGGSPGNAPRALAVAATNDAQAVVDSLNVTAPASIAGSYAAERSVAYDYDNKPDLQGDVSRVADPNNLDGCKPLSTADAAAVNGKIAFVEWTDDDTVRACGSVGRSANLAAAGATGFIFADDEESFGAGITGSAVIPGVLVAKSGGDAIRTQLVAGNTVSIISTTRNGTTQTDPGLNDTLAKFSSRGSRGNLDGTDFVKPDVAAVGGTVFSTSSGTGNEGENESGTSMAAPMVAGTAGLVTSMHPDWTAEQVKADIMNTAGQDVYTKTDHEGRKYAPNRVGAGRIDIKAAVRNKVLAYVTDDPGVVSASFGPIEATPGRAPLTKTIKVQNTGNTGADFDVSYRARTEIPGVTYTVSPTTVSLDPRSSKNVTLTLTIDASQLTKTIDPTVDRDQGGLPREYVADASGLVIFKGAGVPNLRVPVYSAPRPASNMTQAPSVTLPGGAVQKANVALTGDRVKQGSGDTSIVSTIAGFELQASSGLAPDCSGTVTSACVHYRDERSADLKYVGATSSAPQLDSINEDPLTSANGLAFFSVTTQGPWRSPVGFQEVDVYIDSTGDGVADAVTYTTRLTGTDVMVAKTIDLSTGATLDVEGINDRLGDTDTALFDSDTLVLPVAIGALPGVTADHSRISYSVLSFSGASAAAVDQVGDVAGDGTLVDPLSMDVLNPGVAVYGSYNGDTSALLYADSPGTLIQVRRDAAAYAADNGQGVLMVHFHNKVGNKAQVVTLNKEASTTSLTLTPSPAKQGKKLTGKVTVTGDAGVATGGTVTLKRGGTVTVGSAPLVNGTASISFTPQSSGTYSYSATWSGNGTYSGSTSPLVSVKINPKATPKVTLTMSPNPAKKGKALYGTVKVTGPAGTAIGQVTLKRVTPKVATVATKVLGPNGTVRLGYTPKGAGTFYYVASYGGDSNYKAADSAKVKVTIK